MKLLTREYFGYRVDVFKADGPYPYTFEIQWSADSRSRFAGIPNRCSSTKEALMRAWWHCKWKREGKYPYQTVMVIPNG